MITAVFRKQKAESRRQKAEGSVLCLLPTAYCLLDLLGVRS